MRNIAMPPKIIRKGLPLPEAGIETTWSDLSPNMSVLREKRRVVASWIKVKNSERTMGAGLHAKLQRVG